MTWNYRAVFDAGVLGICEVYSDGLGIPQLWSSPTVVQVSEGEGLATLACELDKMRDALAKPVLRVVGEQLIEEPHHVDLVSALQRIRTLEVELERSLTLVATYRELLKEG